MKKIFTFLCALVLAGGAVAQNHGAMNFVGTSTFYVINMQESTTTHQENDCVTLTLTGEGNKQAEIVIPDMQYDMNGNIMTLKSFTANSGVEYTMTGSFQTGDMAFEWAEGGFSTTTTGADGNEKTVTGTISAKYGHSTKKLEVAVDFNYGSMPFAIHYEMSGDYLKPSGVMEVADSPQSSDFNLQSSVFNMAGQRIGDDARGLVIVGGRKVIR